MGRESATRRDLTYFMLGPGLLTFGVAALYHLAPWPTPTSGQAANFGWGLTAGYLAVGAVGAALASHVGCPSAPNIVDRRAWLRILLWSLAAGLASGAVDIAISDLTPW